MSVIKFNDVSFSYNQFVPTLENVDVTINAGEFLGIVGPNGAGKSTILKLILGLIEPNSGSIEVFGNKPQKSRSLLGYVPQFANFNQNFPISVLDVVLMGMLDNFKKFPCYSKGEKARALAVLDRLGSASLACRSINELSGGQLQRVLVARALIGRPKVLLLDEPTANVDVQAEENIYSVLKKLNEYMTIVVVSHDIGFITNNIKRVICVNRRVVCHKTEHLSVEIMEELYKGPINLIKHDRVEK
ncbi:MAG: ABC transporter ATP-binding protein [Gammaproteobacteria bacterium]|nr:ABC transporter ATP-binding protein [Gammaproteobacteria bacterium]